MVEKPVDRQSTSLLSHLLDHVVETPRGIAFLGTLSICAVGSAICYVVLDKGKKKRLKKAGGGPARRALRLALGGMKKKKDFTRSVVAVIGGVALFPIGVGMSMYLQRQIHSKFGNLAACVMRKDWNSTFTSLYDVGLIALPLVLTQNLLKVLESRMASGIRINLEKKVREIYTTKTSFETKKELKDTFSSLSTDCRDYSRRLAEMYCGISTAICQIIAKPVLLTMHMGLKEFSVLITFEALMRGYVLRRLFPSLDYLSEKKTKAEGVLTSASSHVAASCAEITLIGGGSQDLKIVNKLGTECVAVSDSVDIQALFPNFLRQYMGGKVGQVVAFVTMLPAVYYSTDSKTRTGQNPLMYLTNAVHDLVDFGKSIGLMFSQISKVDDLSGIASRILTIPDTAMLPPPPSSFVYEELKLAEKGRVLHLESVSMRRRGRVEEKGEGYLLENVNLEVKAGARVLIRGSNGSGKTSLIRLISGRFSTAFSTGTIRCIPSDSCGFLPARNYFPPQSSLADHLAYPKPKGDFSMADMAKALREMGLSDLVPGLSNGKVFDPKKTLSDGEQRRLSLARVWLHQPYLAFLDEPLVSIRGVEPYVALARRIPTLVTISHNNDPAFEKLHSMLFTIQPHGKTVITNLDHEDNGFAHVKVAAGTLTS